VVPRWFGLVLAVLLLTLASTAGALDLAEARASGTLRWGGDLQGGEPYVFEDEQRPGGIVGFEVEIAEALAARLGLRAVFVQTDWSNLVLALERGNFELILNGLEETPERRARLSLSLPYFVYGETLTVRQGAPYSTLADLKGRRVGTLNQTVAHDLLRASGAEVVLYEGQQEPYFDLAKGRTEAVLLDHVIADRYGCKLPALHCSSSDIATGHYVIGMQKTHVALQRAIDQALLDLRQTGELERILSRWQLWDARQMTASPEPPRTSAASQTSLPSSSFGAAHLMLFLQGALVTLILSVAAFALASPLGVTLAIARLYGPKWAAWLSAAYVEVFRGTPLLLQLYVLYFGVADWVRLQPFTAAILGLGLNYAAYEAEVHRAALQAVPQVQMDSARALGLNRWQALKHVMFPQALRTALPTVTNDFVALLKDSSLVSVITVVELTKRMTILAVELRDWVLPGALCALLYFGLGFPLSQLAQRIERRLEAARTPPLETT